MVILPLWEIGEPQGSELLRHKLLGHLHGNQLATTKTNPIYLPHPKEKKIGCLWGAIFASISKSDKFLLFLPLWEIGEPQGSQLLRRQLLGHLHGNQLATTKTSTVI